MSKQEHLDYIKNHDSFNIKCDFVIFDNEEIEVLQKYGYWFEALQEGILSPLNDNQKRFVEVANSREKPKSLHEKVWWKYLKRKEIEVNYKDSLYKEYHLKEDSFYNRGMVKVQRKQMFGVMNENHKK